LYIANSQTVANTLIKREKIPQDKITVIGNGIDTKKFDVAQRGLVRSELDINDGRIVITCVANFRKAKDHHTLINAIENIKSYKDDITVWLVGKGPMLEAVQGRVDELGLDHCVKFLGTRLDIPEILADSDVFVLSSLWEGMPGVIMEAMASKLPVVATDVGGIPELVVDNETGLLVTPGNPEQLALALKKMIDDKKLRTLFGNAGYHRIVTQFNLRDKVKELEQVYFQLACKNLNA
jgi:glycosyltransferase involved in cell wall biosynthesis